MLVPDAVQQFDGEGLLRWEKLHKLWHFDVSHFDLVVTSTVSAVPKLQAKVLGNLYFKPEEAGFRK